MSVVYITAVGKGHIGDQMSDQGQAKMAYIAAGTGTGGGAGSTTLVTEIFRKACIATQGAGADANKVTYVVTLSPGEATGLIKEFGIFNAAFGGQLLAYVADDPSTKGENDTWVVNIVVTYN